MGLDMYWFAGKTPEEKTQAMLTGEDTEAREEIGYFRKFHDLNDFMGTLYPPGTDNFNCKDLEITRDVLAAMRDWEYEFENGDTLEDFETLCQNIETALDEGRRVVYWPWW